MVIHNVKEHVWAVVSRPPTMRLATSACSLSPSNGLPAHVSLPDVCSNNNMSTHACRNGGGKETFAMRGGSWSALDTALQP